MCDFSGRLVAWMDRELAKDEAAEVRRHVRACTECRGRVDAYEKVSREFVAYCDETLGEKTRRRLPRWVPVLSTTAAAAVLLLVLQSVSVKQIPVRPRAAEAAPALVLQTVSRPVKGVHRRPAVSPMKSAIANWGVAEPAIRIAIPVEAMFPPGAVPAGITLIADVSMAADGSVQGLRLQ
jgi:hypothetical protein